MRWKKSAVGRYKANFDAALDKKQQKMGVGVVVRDCNGDIVALMCAVRKCVSPFVAKCKAIWEAMEMWIDLGFRDVMFGGDVKEVVTAVMKGKDYDSCYGQNIEGIKQYLCTKELW